MAGLKLIEQGKITLDTPVSDYLPEFSHPIIVDETSTQKTDFVPAETVVTFRHLLNFTSGLSYRFVTGDSSSVLEGFTSKDIHHSQDPISELFKIIIVRLFSLITGFE